MTSRIVFFFGSSRSRRRSATVTSSQPDASSAASIASSSGYLPVPRKSLERSSTPAITSRSTAATACMGLSLPSAALPQSAAQPDALRKVLLYDERLVAAVCEPLDSLSDRKPHQLVHLDTRPEAATAHLHD